MNVELNMRGPHRTEVRIREDDNVTLLVGEHGETVIDIDISEDLERAKEIADAFSRSGLDVSPCRSCGESVICIPDGLPYCDECNEGESEPWYDSRRKRDE